MKYTNEFIARKAAFAGHPAAVARLMTEMRNSYEARLAEVNAQLAAAVAVIEREMEGDKNGNSTRKRSD